MFEVANHLVLKVTKGCNLRCEYCYVKDKDENEGKFIDFELFKKIIDKIVEDKLKDPEKKYTQGNFHMTFHGGEPTTMDKSLFYKMCEYAQYQFNLIGMPTVLSIQTNLTLVDEEWCKLFSKFNIHVGASWDGIDEANIARTEKTTESYLEKAALMDKYNITYGFLTVLNKHSLPLYEKSIEFFHEKFKIPTKANYVEDVFTPLGEESDFEIKGSDFFNIVTKSEIDYFIEHGETRESNTEDIIRRFIVDYLTNTGNYYAPRGNCYIKYCGSGINIIEINPDGTVQLCGRYGDNNGVETTLSTAVASDFLSIRQIKKHLNFTKAKIIAMKKSHCDNCIAQNICDHGCMAFYYSKTGKWGIRNDLTCSIFKPTYNYLLEKSLEVLNAFFKHELPNTGNVFYLPLPSHEIAYFDIYANKVRDLINKHNISITNDDSNLIFKKE